MIKIYYTNLGLYNEGILSGEWVDLPVSGEELENVKQRTGYDETHEEYFITDYETDVDGLKIDEFDDLDELNKIAELIEDNDEDIIAALIYFGYDTADEIADRIDDVIYIDTPQGWESDEEAVGRHYADECLTIPEEIEMYFDYEAYGRDIMISGSFYTAEDGSIYVLIA